MQTLEATVKSNILITESAHEIQFDCQMPQSFPGQFISVLCGSDTISPRPFSIFSQGDNMVSICFDVKGVGTQWLSKRRVGDKVEVFGPLGNHFNSPKSNENVLFVAGGMGIVPILRVINSIEAKDQAACLLLYGVRSVDQRIINSSPARWCNTRLISESGSSVDRGLVTDYLEEAITDIKPDMVFACGPRPMLAQVKRILEPHNIPCQVSVEEIMGCGGQGHCCGCAIERADGKGYSLVCQEGPVFDIREVAL